MKTNNLEEAMKAFLSQNPELPEGEETVVEQEIPTVKSCLRVSIDKKGRNGKTATLVEGFENENVEEIESLSKELKKVLGTGGSYREREILIQGDRVNDVKAFLKQKGFKVK